MRTSVRTHYLNLVVEARIRVYTRCCHLSGQKSGWISRKFAGNCIILPSNVRSAKLRHCIENCPRFSTYTYEDIARRNRWHRNYSLRSQIVSKSEAIIHQLVKSHCTFSSLVWQVPGIPLVSGGQRRWPWESFLVQAFQIFQFVFMCICW